MSNSQSDLEIMETKILEPANFKMRPSVHANPDGRIVFHLREICSVALERYDESLWLFGNTPEKTSVAIRVTGFQPYLLIDSPFDIGDLDTWVADLNDDIRAWPKGPDIVTRADVVERVSVVGFTANTPRNYIKLTYKNQSYVWRVRNHFKQDVDVGGTPRRLNVYHDDWSVESLFLHESRLKMQHWVSVRAEPVNTRVTGANVERQAAWDGFQLVEAPVPMPPILCCALRLRVVCSASTPGHPVAPSAHVAADRVACIAVQLYWMGEQEKRSFTFDHSDEGVLLKEFEAVVHGQFDVDCFQYLSDTCDPLIYIGTRDPSLKLSKFSAHGSKLLRRKLDRSVYGILHPGRSRLDIQHALKKMMVEPQLDGYTLKDAIYHPRIVRDTPPAAMRDYSFTLPVNNRTQCQDEVDWMTRVEQQNSMLLGFVEISAASYTQLTVAIANGQQIRVWKKLISKFHHENLIVNKQQLLRPPLTVKRTIAESSFADPPDVPNVPLQARACTSSTRCRNLMGDIVEVGRRQAKTSKKLQGGYVCEPESGFHREPTFTFDFESLYPNIIRSHCICYMRLVYDPTYLGDAYVKTYVPINPTDCIVLIDGVVTDGTMCPSRTILPQTISEVCEERTRAKKLMLQTQDGFLRASLNAKQLGCKVFQNAVYGFLGVEDNALLACPVLMATVCRIGQNMIKRVRHMLITDHKGYVVYGDTDSVMVQFPRPINLQTRATMLDHHYGKCVELAVLATALFPYPNRLQFETMKYPFWLGKKKNYAALEYPDHSWRVEPKLTIKGLAFKKRDRCLFVRRVGLHVMECILQCQSASILPYLKREITGLIQNRVPYDELAITCRVQEASAYKNENLIQLETVRRLTLRTGTTLESGSRLSYVVLRGEKPLYQRGMDTAYAKENLLPIDLSYYFEKQLLGALEPLLQFHDELAFASLVRDMRHDLQRKVTGVRTLGSMLKKRAHD